MCTYLVAYDERPAPANAGAAEKNLVIAAIQGDAAAFETLALRHKRIVMSIAWRMTGSSVEAEDLTQQTFLKAFANVSRFGDRCSFSTWLVSIAVNEVRMWRRKARKSREVAICDLCTDETLDAPPDFMDSRPDPEAIYSQTERKRLLFSELERLKPGMRAALQLCDLEEHSPIEASVALGISENGMNSRRLRGRAILRKRLEARLWPTQDHHTGKVLRSKSR